jgi:transcriptional regulator with GAF, ATPase, and Fis domain
MAVTVDDRVEFEWLISDISARLVARTTNIDSELVEALESIRQFFRADRCGLMTVGADGQTIHNTHHALGVGVPPVPSGVNLLALCPWVGARLLVDREAVRVARLADLPANATRDRGQFELLAMRSVLVVPITLGTAVSRLIMLSMCQEERDWLPEFIPRLRVLGELMANAVRRVEAFEALQTAHDEVKRLRDRAERENVYLRRQVAPAAPADLVVGRSAAIRRALEMAQQVATTASTVLLMGETGTGKERFAEYIHQASPRRARHMVRVNCSAIPSALVESELFGREKGAYTGALSKQIGRFELAHESTLFLDEIGDLPTDVQVKLLRVLQERTIERLGSPRPVPVDVRIIAATNRDLEAHVRAGLFRSDLYYRLNVFPIVVPPLRERRDDMPDLVEMLVRDVGENIRKHFERVDADSLRALAGYEWPGNVRELRNVLERAMILSSGPTLVVEPPRPPHQASDARGSTSEAAGDRALRAVERAHVLHVLNDTGWRIRGKGGAAEILGLKPSTLETRMQRLGIRRPGPLRARGTGSVAATPQVEDDSRAEPAEITV